MTNRRIARLSLLFLFFLIGAVSAKADIIIDGDAAFTKSVRDCLELFNEAGAETAAIVNALERSSRDHVIQESNNSNSTVFDNEKDGHSVDDGGTGDGTGTTISWDPDYRDPYQDGTARDPCASLLHELRHALDGDTGTGDRRPDPGTRIPRREEIRCCREENRYRKRVGLPQRQQYGDKALPADAKF